jgi:predicted metalloprotease
MWMRSVAALVLLVLVASCSVVVPGVAGPVDALSPTAGSTPPSTGPRSTPAVPAGVDPEVAADIESAERIVNDFWTRHWSETFTGEYVPPTVVGLYDGRDPGPDTPTCAGEVLPPDNALYCPPGDFVAWDAGLMSRSEEIGDAWVYLIVAHEWGHAIQQRIDVSLNSVQSELQADCLAGATLYGAVADGQLQFEEGDVKELTNSLTLVADETPWSLLSVHGDPFQRIGAFDLGRTGGVRGCLPMNSTTGG